MTLPPVGVFTYPSDAAVPIAQISVDDGGPVAVPLLTIYGDRRVVAAVGGRWLTGIASELDVQDFFEDAEGVGLLDADLVLRSVVESDLPDVAVSLEVDGGSLRHELDLARIERPIALRAFLQRAVGADNFGLTQDFAPAAGWLTCDEQACSVSPTPTGPTSRPVLPHEDAAALAATAAPDEP